jgi:hypothetical protein
MSIQRGMTSTVDQKPKIAGYAAVLAIFVAEGFLYLCAVYMVGSQADRALLWREESTVWLCLNVPLFMLAIFLADLARAYRQYRTARRLGIDIARGWCDLEDTRPTGPVWARSSPVQDHPMRDRLLDG